MKADSIFLPFDLLNSKKCLTKIQVAPFQLTVGGLYQVRQRVQ